MATQTVTGGAATEGGVEILTELLAGLVGTAAKLHLFKSGFNPTAANVYADYVAEEADFHGYLAVDVTYGLVSIDASGNPVLLSAANFFQNDDGSDSNLIGGAWLSVETDAGPPAVNVVQNYYKFDPPITLGSALAFCNVTIAISAPDMSGYAVVES